MKTSLYRSSVVVSAYFSELELLIICIIKFLGSLCNPCPRIIYISMFSVVLAVGVKESTTFNNIFTGLNLLVVVYSVICGAFKADTKNWDLSPHNYSVSLNSISTFSICEKRIEISHECLE